MWDLTIPGNGDHDFYVLPADSDPATAYHVDRNGVTAVLVHNCDHVVLGMNPHSDDLVAQLREEGDSAAHNYNGEEYRPADPNGDGRPSWMSRVSAAIGDKGTRLSVALDGVNGATSAADALDRLVDQGRPLIGPSWEQVEGNGTAWEMALIRLKVVLGDRDWSSIDWYLEAYA